MNTLKITLAIGLLALVGCDRVIIDAPFGEPLDRGQAAQFDGKWGDDEGNVVEFHLTREGKLIAGTIAWDDDAQQFIANNEPVDARTLDGVIYAFLSEDSVTSFARIEVINESEIVAHLPIPMKFRSAVESGKLAGTVKIRGEHFTVKLVAGDASTAAFFASKDWRSYYSDEKIISLTRLGKPAEKTEATPEKSPATIK